MKKKSLSIFFNRLYQNKNDVMKFIRRALPKCAQFVTGDVAIPQRNTSGCLAKIIPVAYPPYPLPQIPIRSLSMNLSESLRYLWIHGQER